MVVAALHLGVSALLVHAPRFVDTAGVVHRHRQVAAVFVQHVGYGPAASIQSRIDSSCSSAASHWPVIA